VYFVYGMHWCANVTTGPPGSPSAVLLRGGRVTAGLTTARSRRPGRPDALLARGPAALAAVLALTGADTGSTVALRSAPGTEPRAVPGQGPRVGVRGGADTPWRFWIPGEPGVSSYRRASSRPRAGGSLL
jgi:DNA-3-methyladenine glycosylase